MWKVILVTGGNKGIGLAIVEALLQEVENSVVLLGSRDAVRGQEAVDGVVAKLGKQFQPRLQPVLIDVTSQESVDKAAAVVKRDHGKIFGVINNAGGSFTGLRATIDLNSYGVLRVCEAFAPLIEDGGRIVQVSLSSCQSKRFKFFMLRYHRPLVQALLENAVWRCKSSALTLMSPGRRLLISIFIVQDYSQLRECTSN